jgi:hypothetical protein
MSSSKMMVPAPETMIRLHSLRSLRSFAARTYHAFYGIGRATSGHCRKISPSRVLSFKPFKRASQT